VAVIKPRRPKQRFKIRILRVRNAHVTRATPAHSEEYRPGWRRLNTRSVTQVTLRVHLAGRARISAPGGRLMLPRLMSASRRVQTSSLSRTSRRVENAFLERILHKTFVNSRKSF